MSFEHISLIVCLHTLFYIWYILIPNLRNYPVLALWLLEPGGTIQPLDLKMTESEFDEFARFRSKLLRTFYNSTFSYCIVFDILLAYLVYHESLHVISPGWTLFWYLTVVAITPFLNACKSYMM